MNSRALLGFAFVMMASVALAMNVQHAQSSHAEIFSPDEILSAGDMQNKLTVAQSEVAHDSLQAENDHGLSKDWTDNWNIYIPWPGKKRSARDLTQEELEEIQRWFDGWNINILGKRSLKQLTPEELEEIQRWFDNWTINFGRKRSLKQLTPEELEEIQRWFDGWTINFGRKRSLKQLTPEELEEIQRWFDNWTINFGRKRSLKQLTPEELEELQRWFDGWTVNILGKRSLKQLTPEQLEELQRWFDGWTINIFGKRNAITEEKRWLQNWTFNQGEQSATVSGVNALTGFLNVLMGAINGPQSRLFQGWTVNGQPIATFLSGLTTKPKGDKQ